MLHRLRENLGTLLLALILALTVWVAAISQDDPIVERVFPQQIDINYTGLSDGMLIVGQVPETATVTIRAPESVWNELSSQEISLRVDLSEIEAGAYRVKVKPSLGREPARVTDIEPEYITLNLEPSISKEVSVIVVTFDQPALGYEADDPIAKPDHAIVVGPASIVEQVSELRAEISLTNRWESMDQEVALDPVDEKGQVVPGIQVQPEKVRITVQIERQPLVRQVSVIANIQGNDELDTAGHYRVTNISVTPSEVLVSSSDQEALNALGGYVYTIPLDIREETEDVLRRLTLDLPASFSILGEQSVLVQITIVPVIESITITCEVEIQGLGLDLYPYASPSTVDVILTGPAATLDALQTEDIHVLLDMLDYGVGTYQLTPQVIVLLPDLEFGDTIPATIEVTLTTTPPPTPTPDSTP